MAMNQPKYKINAFLFLGLAVFIELATVDTYHGLHIATVFPATWSGMNFYWWWRQCR